MRLNQLDIITRDVHGSVAFFRDALGLVVEAEDDRFAQLDAGGFTLMLSPDAMVATGQADGVILHFEVEDVQEATTRAEAASATVLLAPTKTDWVPSRLSSRGREV